RGVVACGDRDLWSDVVLGGSTYARDGIANGARSAGTRRGWAGGEGRAEDLARRGIGWGVVGVRIDAADREFVVWRERYGSPDVCFCGVDIARGGSCGVFHTGSEIFACGSDGCAQV